MTGRRPQQHSCNLRTAGHAGNPGIPDFIDRPTRWVQGRIETLSIEFIDDVPGVQPIRFVPDLSMPHNTEDPIGLTVELFHHSSVRIRNLVARGFTPLWYPTAQALFVGHRVFHMSLEPVPVCEAVVSSGRLGEDMRNQIRREILQESLASYRAAFDEWARSGTIVSDIPVHGLLNYLMKAWAQPGFEPDFLHQAFREALLDEFREATLRAQS